MNRSVHFSLIAMSLCAVPVLADERPFVGAAIGATAGLAHVTVEYAGFLAGHTSSDNDFVGGINAAYGFAVGDSAVFALGASYRFGSVAVGTTSYQDSGQTYDVSGKLKNHWSVFLAPGLRFATKGLAYAKLGYHTLKSDYTDTQAGSGQSRHHGIGYGIGVAYVIAPRLEVSAELQHVRLNSASFALSSGKPSLSEVNAGLTYRF